MAYRHTYVFADGVTQSPYGTPVVPYPLITANGFYPSDMGFLFQGGSGQFAIGGTVGGGTYQIQQRLPDQSTWVNIPGAVLTSAGIIPFAAAESSRIRLSVTGATAPSASAYILDLPEGATFSSVMTLGGGTGGSTQVEGNTASGATDSGNPVKGGAVYRTTAPTYSDGQRTELQSDSRGSIKVVLYGPNGTLGGAVQGPSSDGQAVTGSLATIGYQLVYNGVTWDRWRGDVNAANTKQPPLVKNDRSITASTTSQQAAAANSVRSKILVENLDATNAVFVNFGAAATTGLGSKRVGPQGTFEFTGTNQALNIIAAAGTPLVTVWEF